jgi:inosine-uridine nucleoside N-ribohydrolase
VSRRLLTPALVGGLFLVAAGCQRADDSAAAGRTAVWLDISPAIGDPPSDPGHALALLQAYGSERLRVRGVSVTFGNVPLERGLPAAQELLQRLDSDLLRAWRGPSAPDERAAPTEASELLEEALRNETLTVIAAGPATTVAAVLQQHPDIAPRIERVIMVGGTRLDSIAGNSPTRQPDVNIGLDAASVQVLLDSPVALTFVPPAAASQAGLDAEDLDRLDRGRGPIALITPSARQWLDTRIAAGEPGGIPVAAMLAVDVAAHPGTVRCESAVASLVAGDTPGRPRLIIATGTTGRRVTSCHMVDAGARQRMVGDVLRVQRQP